jgi:hypothetical protein
MSRYETNDVKAAAVGHWPAIINRVAGIEDDYLSTTHGPCPKCGGNDRWRVFDDFQEKGGGVCNQCGKFGDGLAVILWYCGIGFPETVKRVAEFLGVQPAKAIKKTESKPAELSSKLEWLPWAEMTAKTWCHRKGGLTQEALLAMGARLGRYRRKHLVIALPVVDITGKPTGWTMYEAYGGLLPEYKKGSKEPVRWLKVKTIKVGAE